MTHFGMPSPPPAGGTARGLPARPHWKQSTGLFPGRSDPFQGRQRGRLNAMSYVVWHKIALFLAQDDQKAPLKGELSPQATEG